MAAVKSKTKMMYAIFLIPGVLIYGIFFVYPVISAFPVSLYRWSGLNIRNMEYVGLANFKELLSDSIFWKGLYNNFYAIIVGGILVIGFAFLFAIAFTRLQIKGKDFFQMIIFFPMLISGIGVGIMWSFVYNPGFGVLKYFLNTIGLGGLNRPWLGLRETAFPVIVVSFAWWSVGFYLVLYVAAIKRIPRYLYDSAKIDGANEWQITFHVILPLMRRIFLMGVLYWTVIALKMFDLPFVMTEGGPAHMTETISTHMYKTAFGIIYPTLRLGYGTSIAVFLFIVTLGFSYMYLRITAKETVQY